jgi:hypothetical protein
MLKRVLRKNKIAAIVLERQRTPQVQTDIGYRADIDIEKTRLGRGAAAEVDSRRTQQIAFADFAQSLAVLPRCLGFLLHLHQSLLLTRADERSEDTADDIGKSHGRHFLTILQPGARTVFARLMLIRSPGRGRCCPFCFP